MIDVTSNQPLRVLQIGMGAFEEQRGGLNRYFDGLHRALNAAGAEVTSVVVAGADVSPSFRAAAPMSTSLTRRLLAVHRLARDVGARCDVVDTHFALYGLLPVLVGPLRRRPLVVHFQGPWAAESQVEGAGRIERWAKARIERSVYSRADAVVTLSTSFATLLVERYQVDPDRVHVLTPGLDLAGFAPGDRATARRESGLPESAFTALAVRRLVPRMGLDLLIDGWARVVGERPDAMLCIAGDGSQRSTLTSQVDALGLGGNVRLLGNVSEDELATLYRAADVTVVPSVALEGFGLVTLESLASGTPVVGTDVGGIPEVLRPLDPSLIVHSGDVEALARRLLDAASGDRPLPDASTCRSHAARADWSTVASNHLELYGPLVARRRPRVVFVDHVARLSGGELALARLIGGLHGVDAHVVLAEHGPLEAVLHERGAHVEVLPLATRARDIRRGAIGSLGSVRAVLSSVPYVLRLARHLRSLRPDVVHTNSLKADVLGGLAGRLARVPVVWHVRDHIAPWYLPRLVAIGFRLSARFVPNAIIANSRSTMATLGRGARGQERIVVPSPLDPSYLDGSRRVEPGRPFRVAMVARLAPWKGQDVFVRAFGTAFPDGDEEAFVIGGALFGEEGFEAALRAAVAASPARDRIHLLGHRDDVADLLRDVDVLVHASTIPEPFGQVVAEGMALGLAVVAADAGGPAELVRPGENGLLVTPGDVDQLAAALRQLADDPALRARLGAEAVKVVESVDVTAVAADVEALYRRLRGRGKRRSAVT